MLAIPKELYNHHGPCKIQKQDQHNTFYWSSQVSKELFLSFQNAAPEVMHIWMKRLFGCEKAEVIDLRLLK